MKIKDVIKIAATFLGRTDVTAYLESGETESGSETLQTVNLMTNLTNLVITELSSTYIPLKTTENVYSSMGKIYYSRLSQTPVRTVSVSFYGKQIDYGYNPEYLIVPHDGMYTVEYEYTPSNLGLDDHVGYTEKDITATILAYGLAAEFCITEGGFEQAVMWHKRYADGIERLCMPKNRRISERRWE